MQDVDAVTNSPTGPLDGVRVLELGTLIAGPYCGQLLSDFGAEVIKVEDPAHGDPMRSWGHLVNGVSLHWSVIGRGKRSVTCNLRTTEGQELVRELVKVSDVLLENFRPGTIEKWGLGPETLREINPRLIVTRVSGFGQDGPYSRRAGFGSVGEAMGGLRYMSGEPDRQPSRVGISIGDSLAGTFAALGTAFALFARERTGVGQVVDSAIYEAVLALTESLLADWDVAGVRRERTGAVLPGVAPSNVYLTSGGDSVLIAANRDTIFARLTHVMEQPELATDPRFATHAARGQRAAELDAIIGAWTSRHATEPLLDRLHDHGIPASLIYTAQDMLIDPHFKAREAIVRILDERVGEIPMQNVAPRLSGTPGAVRGGPPELGEDTAQVLTELLAFSSAEQQKLRSAGII